MIVVTKCDSHQRIVKGIRKVCQWMERCRPVNSPRFSVSLTGFGPISWPNSSRLKVHSAKSHGFQSHNVDMSGGVMVIGDCRG